MAETRTGPFHTVDEAAHEAQKSSLMSIDKDGRVEYVVNPNRIEALRAASLVAAGIASGGQRLTADGEEISVNEYTTGLAEQFARWLEEGEQEQT